jgi:DNA-binding NarL/FixJ family response regulator
VGDRVVSRTVEIRAVADFLTAASAEPSALVLEGEAGIGKTTLWLAALTQAQERGFCVLSARPGAAESVLAYAALADLLGGVDAAVWAGLPDPQHRAVDRVLLRANDDGAATDQHTVAAGFLEVVDGLAEQTPVLLAIDDLQWLDVSSAHVLAFAVRRLAGRVGVLGAVRTHPGSATAGGWLQVARPDAVRRITVGPLSLGSLHAVLCERLGRSFSRPTMVRIHDICGGNPFYALELARAIDDASTGAAPLPGTLAELVRARVGNLDADVHDVLLAVACLTEATVKVVAGATGYDTERVVGCLEGAERQGIIGFEGQQLRFTHPLLARGVYTDAAPARRRLMHRRLAGIVEHPELAARHLALAATSGDPQTLEALDAAAKSARNRGAPAAAAELVELAIGLGGDTPKRRIRLAGDLFHAGDLGRARRLLADVIDGLEPGVRRVQALNLLALVRIADDSFLGAIGVLQRALDDVAEVAADEVAADKVALRAPMLLMLSWLQLNVGDPAGAAVSAEDAVTGAEQLGVPRLLSQALSCRAVVGFLRGDGLDEPGLRRALELEERPAGVPVAFWPTMHHAMLLGWVGQLESAREQMASIREHCLQRGGETAVVYVAFYLVQIEIWQGNLTDAAVVAQDAMERALQMGGDASLSAAMVMRAALGAYTGRVDEARRDAQTALAASRRVSAPLMEGWVSATLGFVEVSAGNYDAALTALAPLLSGLAATPEATEIFVASFIPDAAEALIAVGRLDEAEALIAMLECNGARLDRAWMLAIGARCRAMLWAARGDLDAASAAAQQAVAEHDRLPMPFERARTQLLVGQIQRRARRKDAAAASVREALATFEELGTPLWAERARAELARANVGPRRTAGLTPSEQRVAELAASGMTNRDVAAALFISPKTVEFHLAQIYRQLGIHSRAELARLIGGHGD